VSSLVSDSMCISRNVIRCLMTLPRYARCADDHPLIWVPPVHGMRRRRVYTFGKK
jgi:hypothetical protein